MHHQLRTRSAHNEEHCVCQHGGEAVQDGGLCRPDCSKRWCSSFATNIVSSPHKNDKVALILGNSTSLWVSCSHGEGHTNFRAATVPVILLVQVPLDQRLWHNRPSDKPVRCVRFYSNLYPCKFSNHASKSPFFVEKSHYRVCPRCHGGSSLLPRRNGKGACGAAVRVSIKGVP